MRNVKTPYPNPGDWCTTRGAATLLGVSGRTVERMILDKRIKGYAILGAPDRAAAKLLWRQDVDDLAAALAKIRERLG